METQNHYVTCSKFHCWYVAVKYAKRVLIKQATETNLRLPGQVVTNLIPQPEHFTAVRQDART